MRRSLLAFEREVSSPIAVDSGKAEIVSGALAERAHKTISAAGFLGFKALSDACARLECRCIGRDEADLESLCSILSLVDELRRRALPAVKEPLRQLSAVPQADPEIIRGQKLAPVKSLPVCAAEFA